MFPFRRTRLTLAVTGLLAWLAWLWFEPFGHVAAEHWRRQLEDAPAEQVEPLAGRLAQLGAPGIRALVDALGSRREVVASAARRVLWAELARWETLPIPAIMNNLAVLAESLSQNAERFGPAARRDATDLAAEILRWLPDSGAANRVDVIGHCDRVFECAAIDQLAVASIATATSLARETLTREARGGNGVVSQPATVPPRPLLETPDMSSALSAVPGGGLPMDTFPSSDLPGSGDRGPAPAGRPGESEAVSSGGSADGPPIRLSSPRELFVPDRIRPLSASEPALRQPEMAIGIIGLETATNQKPVLDSEFGKIETDVLMRWLLADDAAVVSRAEAELRRRGFTDIQLKLARCLFNPDPAVRIELARTLPKLTTIDPVPWLLWLSRDPHIEVRLAAISLMATTGDPALLTRIRQMAREDADAAVQQVARRLDER